MSAYLDELYFDWLYSQVASVRTKNPSNTYRNLFHMLYTKEFLWLVPNDDNRIEDGKLLRLEFLEEVGLETKDQFWMDLGCSMLELLIGLARRLYFEADDSVSGWFWELLENLRLDKYNDRVHIPPAMVEQALDRVIWRTYKPDGSGGLFPLVHPAEDQRKVELWYQLNAYINERG